MDPHRENKRLYQLDEAAVGPEQASKRWQFRNPPHTPRWTQITTPPPTFYASIEYRRDPEALPLPSLIWHEAPDWALYRHVNEHGAGWLSYVPTGKAWFEYRERRPNKEWFELTKPDYEASNWEKAMKDLDKDRFSNRKLFPNEEYKMESEYLTGPKLMQEIANAQQLNENPEVFEIFINGPFEDKWVTPKNWTEIVYYDEHNHAIRIKPSRRYLITQNGEKLEWPEPIWQPLMHGNEYYIPVINNGEAYYEIQRWDGDYIDKMRLNSGMVFGNCQGSLALAKAWLAASGGQ